MQNAEMTKEQVAAIQCSWLGNVEMVGGQSLIRASLLPSRLVSLRTDPSDVRVTNVDLFSISRETLGRYCTP